MNASFRPVRRDPPIPGPVDPTGELPLRALLAEVERRAIRRALDACEGNRTRTAQRLGIGRRQLFDKLREHDLAPGPSDDWSRPLRVERAGPGGGRPGLVY